MFSEISRFSLVLCTAGIGGCGASSASGLTHRVVGDTGGNSGVLELPDAGKPRAFRLATSGAQLLVSGPDLGLQLTPANVAGDADVMDVHQEFYGVPWDTWWSDRDLVVADLMTNCPCTFDATWCSVLDLFRGPPSTSATDTQFYGELLLKAFGTMGLRSYDGTPKPDHYALWTAALGRPIAP